MGRGSHEPVRVFQLLIAILAMTGMELDVIGKPVSPLQNLSSIQPSEPDGADAKGTTGGEARTSARCDLSAGSVPLKGKHRDHTKYRSRLHPLPEIYHVVAVRSKTRAPALPLISLDSLPVRSLNVVLPGRGHENHLHHPESAPSFLHRVCRLIC
jgi:hypothetical protein